MAKRKDRLTKIEEDRMQEELSTLSYDDFNEGFSTLGRAKDVYDEDEFFKENSQRNREIREDLRDYEF